MKIAPREALVYGVVCCSSLFLTAYTVHMLVGGLVSEATEYRLMGGADAVVFVVLGLMAGDVLRRRR